MLTFIVFIVVVLVVSLFVYTHITRETTALRVQDVYAEERVRRMCEPRPTQDLTRCLKEINNRF